MVDENVSGNMSGGLVGGRGQSLALLPATGSDLAARLALLPATGSDLAARLALVPAMGSDFNPLIYSIRNLKIIGTVECIGSFFVNFPTRGLTPLPKQGQTLKSEAANE